MIAPASGGHDLVALLDAQGRIVYASPSHEDVLGYAPEDLVGTIVLELVHPADIQRVSAQVAHRSAEDEPPGVVRVRRKSGDWLRAEVAVDPVDGEHDFVRLSILTLRDLETRELARRDRQALSAQLGAVLRSTPLGLGIVDREHRFVYVNQELAAINGVPVDEHVGRTLEEVLPELAPTLLPLYDRVLDTGEAIRGVEIAGETAARPGERRFWEASYHPVPGPGGLAEGVVAVVQETTAVRREELERARLQRLVEASSDFIAVAKTDSSLLYLNPAARRYAGYAVDEDVTGSPWSSFVVDEDLVRVANEVLPELEASGRWEGVVTIRNRAGGELTPLEWIVIRFEDPELGPLLGGVGRDPRERRAAEARALESTQALETLFALSPIPIFTMDLDRNIARVNPAMQTVFGWPEEQLVGKPPPLESEPTPEILAARHALREGRTVSQQFAVRRQDGTTVRVVGYGAPQFDSAGAHVGSLGFLVDVEEREQARERAEYVGRQQEAVAALGLFALSAASVQAVVERAVELLAERLGVEFAAVLRLQPDGTMLELVAGVGWRDGLVGVMSVGVGADSQAGYTIEVGGPVVAEDLDAERRFVCAPIVAEHGIASGLSTVIAGGAGTWGVLSAHASEPRRYSEDDVNFLRAIATVIAASVRREQATTELQELAAELERRVETRTREAEAAREQALRESVAKTEFLSRMSHELRTPLNAVVGFAQLLSLDEADPGKRESVDQILAAGLHLVGLIDELLDVSQIESGMIEVELEAVDVAELTHEVVGLVAPLAGERSITLEVRSNRTGVRVLADRRRLRQVLLNLLSNAIKYNRDAGSVEVEIAPGGEHVSVSVRDTGRGIAAAEVARIFEPFHRAPGSARVDGTGLGLTVSRALLEAMGGRVRVDSSPGVGSVFTVELRAAP